MWRWMGGEAREAELSIDGGFGRTLSRGVGGMGGFPPMADYQELWRDLGHEKTPSTITLYGRDISNKIPISSERGGVGGEWKEMERKGFSLSLSLGSFRQCEAISFPSCLVGIFFSLLLSASLRRSALNLL